MTKTRPNSTTDVDLAVAGGGPAGLAAAIRARQLGMDALVFEPRPAPVDKACGEGLMPNALQTLSKLGIEPSSLNGFPLDGVRYRDAYDPSYAAEGTFRSGPGRGVRRVELHHRLRRRSEEAGVAFRTAEVGDFEVGDDHVRIGDTTADWLLGADGLHSDVRRTAGLDAGTSEPLRYGVRRHYRMAPWTNSVEVQWSPRGEAYVTPVDDDLVGVAILSEQGGRFDEQITAFPDLVRRLQGAEPASDDRGAGPFHQTAESVTRDRLLLVGDAAGYVDALTGEGVALAVETATAAVEALADDKPSRYDRDWHRITRPYRWLTRLLVAITRHRALHRPLISLLDHVPPLFDHALALLGGAQSARPPHDNPRSR